MYLQSWLHERRRPARTQQAFKGFLRDLRAREPMSENGAARAAAAVLCALELLGSEQEIPGPLRELLQSCPLRFKRRPRALDREELLAIVAEETGTTRLEAERLAQLVLGALRERIAEAELSQLMARLPAEIAALWRPGRF